MRLSLRSRKNGKNRQMDHNVEEEKGLDEDAHDEHIDGQINTLFPILRRSTRQQNIAHHISIAYYLY